MDTRIGATLRIIRFFAVWLWLLLLPLAAAGAGVPVQTLDGKRSSLGEHLSAGKWTLIMVWTTYCHVCRKEYPWVSAFHRDHEAKDAVVLGVSLDGYDQAEKVKAYQAKQAHSFPSVMTAAEDFSDKYARTTGEAFTGTPTYLLFDPKGKLHAFIGAPATRAAVEKAMAKSDP